MDSPLDYCCSQQKSDGQMEEVCLRCGKHYVGSLDLILTERMGHLCDPTRRQKIPKWALVGRKRSRVQR